MYLLLLPVFARVQDLVAHARNWRVLDADVIADRRENMARNVSLLEIVQQKMFETAQDTSMASQYTTRYLTMTEFDAPLQGTDGVYR
jgi:hypothetical protein